MMAEVIAGKTDDPGFIELLNALVRGLTSRHAPEQLWIVQIDNWFDHKWLGFSGMIWVHKSGKLAIHRSHDAAIKEFHQDKVTFPPFSPNRVAGQWSYVRVGDHYTEAPLPVLPHPTKRNPSRKNLHRRVQEFSGSACFVWYSGNTAANGRGSVMVYRVAADRVECWFAAFNQKNRWKLHVAKGASRDDIQQLLNSK
jgi:hypothetical protein